jgi:hypothetical protein
MTVKMGQRNHEEVTVFLSPLGITLFVTSHSPVPLPRRYYEGGKECRALDE